MLGLAELALPQVNFYSTFYPGMQSFPAGTSVPSPSDAPFPEYGFTFAEDMFATMPNSCGGPESAHSSPVEEQKPSLLSEGRPEVSNLPTSETNDETTAATA